MASREKPVIARLTSGLVIRGTTLDFNPERPSFRVTPDGGGRGVEVRVRDMKALFFQKMAADAAPSSPRPAYLSAPDPAREGKPISVLFKDGERMEGWTLSYRPEKPGFFLYPAEPDSPHERVYIVAGAVAEVGAGWTGVQRGDRKKAA
jgi:hypothetical protein